MVSRIVNLEDNPPTAAGISNIQVIGSQLTIFLSNGDSFGPFTLPIAQFVFRGDYVPGQHYNELDIVSVPQQGLFLVRIGHDTSPTDPFDPDATDVDSNALYQLIFGEDVYIYDFGFFYPGKPGLGINSGGYMAAHLVTRKILMPTGLTGSIAKLRVAPDADLSFDILHGGTTVGSVDFATGETDGTFTFTADVTLEVGDLLILSPPVALNNAAKDLTVTFVATRVLT